MARFREYSGRRFDGALCSNRVPLFCFLPVHPVRWAQKVGPTITDETISLDSVMSGFLLPEPATERPPYVPLVIEWPHEAAPTASFKTLTA